MFTMGQESEKRHGHIPIRYNIDSRWDPDA